MKFWYTLTLLLTPIAILHAADECDFDELEEDTNFKNLADNASKCDEIMNFPYPPLSLLSEPMMKSVCAKCPDVIKSIRQVSFPTCDLVLAGVAPMKIKTYFQQILDSCPEGSEGQDIASSSGSSDPSVGSEASSKKDSSSSKEGSSSKSNTEDTTTPKPVEDSAAMSITMTESIVMFISTMAVSLY